MTRLRCLEVRPGRMMSMALACLLLLAATSLGVTRWTGARPTVTTPPAAPTATSGPRAVAAAPDEPAAAPWRETVAERPHLATACEIVARSTSTVPRGLVASGRALIVAGAVNLRNGPSVDCAIVGSLGFGTEVSVAPGVFRNGDHYWRKVTTPNGDGYTIAGVYQRLPDNAPAFVPILMYHHISAGDDNLYVPPDQFDQQLAWLHDHDYVSITPRDLYLSLYRGLLLPEHPVMLTIDDGNASTMTFKHLLDKYGFRGVYFLPNFAHQTPAEIRSLDQSGQVCGHTVSHPYLNGLDYADQYAQIAGNQQWLEKIVGHPVRCLAYPFGHSDATTESVLRDTNIRIAFDATGGACPLSAAVDQYHITRKEIDPVFDLSTFATIVTKGW